MDGARLREDFVYWGGGGREESVLLEKVLVIFLYASSVLRKMGL